MKEVKHLKTQTLLSAFLIGIQYCSWYTANTPTKSVFNALSFGSDPATADSLCIKRGDTSKPFAFVIFERKFTHCDV